MWTHARTTLIGLAVACATLLGPAPAAASEKQTGTRPVEIIPSAQPRVSEPDTPSVETIPSAQPRVPETDTRPAATAPAAPSRVPPTDARGLETATQQVESGARKTGTGLGDTARAVGQTVVEGSKVAGQAVAGAAKAAGEGAKSTWATVRDAVIDFADDVVGFLKRPL